MPAETLRDVLMDYPGRVESALREARADLERARIALEEARRDS
jgi:hypothetical protein